MPDQAAGDHSGAHGRFVVVDPAGSLGHPAVGQPAHPFADPVGRLFCAAAGQRVEQVGFAGQAALPAQGNPACGGPVLDTLGQPHRERPVRCAVGRQPAQRRRQIAPPGLRIPGGVRQQADGLGDIVDIGRQGLEVAVVAPAVFPVLLQHCLHLTRGGQALFGQRLRHQGAAEDIAD